MAAAPGHAEGSPRLIAVVGTNASGKSALGVELARRLGGEVVSADSRQVYRGLDLGSGKLTPAEMAGVRHHLIDVAGLDVVYSVADFQRDAYAAIDDIAARERTPLLVGGTGLYIDAVTEGYDLVGEAPDPARRAWLNEQPTEILAGLLEAADAGAAAAIDARNRRRLVRAVELAERGVSYSDTRRRSPRYAVLKLGLTWPREVLRERIAARLDERLAAGLVEEVRGLLAGGVTPERLDALGLEYRFVLRHLDGTYATEDELSEALGRAIAQFARRQMAWFRRDDEIRWLDADGDYAGQAHTLARTFLG
ncbi:MAG TPA: tRNA (adenosine(37)-N6)-dimethylallyltransferase MiaA [Solirubrobacteraceae bacterium]|nr:tRNA (adenosine(37)-N6)-dimethylallyltransferase MiaA [Solirubrobacteraceae bacterium]